MKEFQFKDFSIYAGSDVLEILLENLIEHSYSRVFVLMDENTKKYCLPKISKYLFDIYPIVIPSGEQHKTLATAQVIWNELFKQNADKNSVLINLGGGMVGDIGGFCAAIYKRGIEYINIPTTLLSMVDSSVGGKTAVDFYHIKNSLGVIQQPKSVYIFPDLLNTLPLPELRNGFAEMLKHGLIADDDYWQELLGVTEYELPRLASLINGSVKIKMKIVKKDMFEIRDRKRLNFGHTIGHAIEAYSLKNDKVPLKHGEAVAIGMVCESYLSKIKSGLSGKELQHISQVILSRFPKYSMRNILSPELIKIMRQDKKNSNDTLQFTLLRTIGKSTVNQECSEYEITAALNYYDSL